MTSFDATLHDRLHQVEAAGLRRDLRRVDSPPGPSIEIDGQKFLNFSSNDYLGLANHLALKEAAIKAIEKFGAGAGASRLICGSLAPFHELEEELAAFKRTEAALTFSTGYATALGTITALFGKNDIIVMDKLIHASVVDAAKLSGAKIRVFAHNDLTDLEDKLKWADANIRHLTSNTERSRRVLVVTESIFSMDGDAGPLREIVKLKNKYGAWLMVDEAHATGLYGKNRCGLAEETGVSDQIEIQMGTLGKAVGASGGYVCGSRTLIDLLVNQARSFIFSTAPVPAAAAAAAAGIKLIQTDEGRKLNEYLWQRVAEFKSAIRDPQPAIPSAIIPMHFGDEARTVSIAEELRRNNIFVPAIRYPSVARRKARLRITLTASHSADEIARLVQALNQIQGNKS